jgi:two-component system sensor histidine kinase ChvG
VVLGAVLVTRSSNDIEAAVKSVREDLLRVFAVTLAITTLLSLYLAGTITRPIRRLAVAAERVREGRGRDQEIPDLSRRRDEIGELSRALRDMTAALWARMDAIERFAADVSHEIKNPLTSLRSAVETTARVSDPEQQRRLLAIVVDDVQRVTRLISDISDASRLDAELSRAQAEPVDMAEMLRMLSDLYVGTVEEGGPPVVVVPPADGERLMVAGLEGRLVQVFRNLIGNAISFSPPDQTIELAARRAGDMVEVTVSDRGPGIPPNKLTAIFDRFYSERPAAEKFGAHSGLGLSISRQIIEAHNGTIFAENRQDGPGARFTVRIPAI